MADELIASMEQNGAYKISRELADKLASIVLVDKKNPKTGVVTKTVSRDCVGRDASVLLEKIGIRIGSDVKCIICETDFEHPFVQHELMMPIMQVNLTLSLFDEEKALGFARNGKNIYAAIKSESDLSDFAVHTDYDGLDIVPSTPEMSEIEYELFRKKEQRAILKGCLAATVERGYYDYVIIDAPPTLGAWVMNIMCASDFVVIPVEASPWGLFCLANMFDFIAKSTEHNSSLEVLGIAITKADERKNYFKETVKTLAESEIARLFETYIRVDSAVEWSQDNSKPVVAYKKYSRSALEYMKLTKEILKYADR